MAKPKLTVEQKRLDTDLWIIVITALTVLAVYILFQSNITRFINDKKVNILLRTLVGAFFQFGLAGLGVTIVSFFRKESFHSYGLKCKGALLSVLLCVLCFVPYIAYVLATKQTTGYLPFQSVWTTKEILSSAFPINAIGLFITAIAWGFFEGFNYVVINEKLNKRYPTKNRWLNWGAITCAVMCVLIHGMVGVSVEGFIEMLTVMIVIYGMLMVKNFTGNAWGCVFIFVFLWNAF
ncbi:MAG: hypothetical protein RSF82_03360 [Angelakisella sp.]